MAVRAFAATVLYVCVGRGACDGGNRASYGMWHDVRGGRGLGLCLRVLFRHCCDLRRGIKSQKVSSVWCRHIKSNKVSSVST